MNDNLKYLNEFFNITNNNCTATVFGSDTLVLTDNDLLAQSLSSTSAANHYTANNNTPMGCYVNFNNTSIKNINLEELADRNALGVFFQSLDPTNNQNPYNACLLSSDIIFLARATQCLILHHKYLFGFQELIDMPRFPVAPYRALNVRATTRLGDTKMENKYYHTYEKHESAYMDIMKSITLNKFHTPEM